MLADTLHPRFFLAITRNLSKRNVWRAELLSNIAHLKLFSSLFTKHDKYKFVKRVAPASRGVLLLPIFKL